MSDMLCSACGDGLEDVDPIPDGRGGVLCSVCWENLDDIERPRLLRRLSPDELLAVMAYEAGWFDDGNREIEEDARAHWQLARDELRRREAEDRRKLAEWNAMTTAGKDCR